jgi:predicted RNase H-like HicB family nuclease
MERTKEAIELYLEVKEDDIEELDFVGVKRVDVQACQSTQRLQVNA